MQIKIRFNHLIKKYNSCNSKITKLQNHNVYFLPFLCDFLESVSPFLLT